MVAATQQLTRQELINQIRLNQSTRHQTRIGPSDPGKAQRARGPRDPFADLLKDLTELNDILIAAGFEGIASAESPAPPPPACTICDDLGWVTKNVRYTDPDFGQVFPCRCKRSEIVQKRIDRLIGNSYVLEAYRGYTFQTFVERCGQDATGAELTGKQDAYLAAIEFGNGESITLGGKVKPLSSAYIYGDYGRGKTGLSALAMFALAANGVACAAIDWRSFMADIKRTYGDKSENAVNDETLISQIGGVSALLVDELGNMATSPTEHEIGLTERLIRLRHARNLPTIYTSNLSPRQLVDKFGEYIAQRIFERAHAIELAGISVRF